jgi:peptidoglycan/LPS O-acetylase OafA/YrhL
VLLRHAVNFWRQPLDSGLLNLWFNGWLGVDLFFALSGFLITHHLLSKWPVQNRKAFIYHYLSKRALRILPLYFFVLLLATLGIVPFFQPDYPITQHALLVHATFLQDYIPYSSILVPLWSLGVEEKFYLMAPMLAFYCYKYNSGRVIVGCIIAIVCVSALRTWLVLLDTNTMVYSEFFWSFRAPFHFSVTAVLSGAIAALLYFKYPSGFLSTAWKKGIKYFSIMILILILCVERWLESEQWVVTSIFISICGVLFATVIYCNLFNAKKSDTLGSKSLRFIAKLAYPLYLVHLMIVPFTKVICSWLFTASGDISFIPYFIVYLALSFIAAMALHLLVEKPFLILKDRI